METVSVEEFVEKWKSTGSILGCPKLRSTGATWLYPLPEDPCKSGDCGFFLCHNYKKGFDKHLIVPEQPLVELLKEHLAEWMEFADDWEIRSFMESGLKEKLKRED